MHTIPCTVVKYKVATSANNQIGRLCGRRWRAVVKKKIPTRENIITYGDRKGQIM